MIMGVADENTTFPAVLQCPLCGKSTLYCYDDTSREDIWLACDNCSVHGNIITFAARIWKLDPAQTLTRFEENGLCSRKNDAAELDRLTRSIIKAEAAEAFWASASKHLWEHEDTTITHKLREFGVSPEIPCSDLIGVAQPKQIDQLCASVARIFPANLARGPVVVLPYYDLPQRLSGFLMLQYGEDLTDRRAFIATSRFGRFKPDVGYYMLKTAMLPPNETFKQAYFVVDDPLWALKAQTTQLRHGLPLLPLCASYDGREGTSYGTNLLLFPHTRRFFASRTLVPATVSQAATARGYVAVPPDRKSPLPNIPAKTVGRLANICRYAQTWQDALEKVFKENNGIAAKAFASELNIDRDKLQRFLQERTTLAHEDAQKILEKIVPHHGVDAIKYRPKNVISRNNKWYTTSGEQIINCAPVITRIIHAENNEKYYDGYIKKDDTAYNFFERAPVIDKFGLFNFVSQYMATHGELVIFARTWNIRALPTALSLHPPQILAVSRAPGWDDRTKEFQFRRYAIKSDGAVIPSPCPELCKTNPLDMPAPEAVALRTIQPLLLPTHENAALWAFAAVTLAGMLAPAMGAAATSFALESNVFQACAPLASALGCHAVEVGAPYRNNSTGIIKILQAASWPTLVSEINDNDRGLSYGVIKSPYSPVMLKTLPQSIPSALSFNWCAFQPAALPLDAADISSLQFIVPGYVQHVLRDRLATKPGQPLVLTILHDLQEWLELSCGASFNLKAAERAILLPEHAHIALMRELSNAISNGDISVLPKPRNSKQNPSYVIRNRQNWWLNKKAVNKYLEQKSGIVPNWNALLNCFVKQGVFNGETTINNLNGFALRRDWCDTFREEPTELDAKNVG